MIYIYIDSSTSGLDTVRPFLSFSSVSCGLQGLVIFNPFTEGQAARNQLFRRRLHNAILRL